MEILNYIRSIFNWAGVEEQPRKRRADFEYEFSPISTKLRRTEELASPSRCREYIIPMKMCDSYDKLRLRRSKPRPPQRWDTKENYIEISDDEDDIRVIDDHISAQSFYNKRQNDKSCLQNEQNQHDIEAVDDDDDVLYVTCFESNEAKAKNLGYKFFKSKNSNSPLIMKSFDKHALLRPHLKKNRISRPSKPTSNRFALNESYRLEEKRKYQELLQQVAPKFATTWKCSTAFRNSTSFGTSLINVDDRSRCRKLVDSVTKKDTPLVDLTAAETNEIVRPSMFFNKFKADILHNSSPFRRNSESIVTPFTRSIDTNTSPFTPKTNDDVKKSTDNIPKQSSPLTVKDSSDSEIECVASPASSLSSVSKSSSMKNILETTPVCTSRWIKELTEKHQNAMREKQRRIEEEKVRKNLYSEHNKKNFNANLEERIRRSMVISEPIEIIEDVSEEVAFPEFTPEQDDAINRALSAGPGSQVLAQKFNMNITRRDLQSLSGLNWLNDEVINFYMNLIMERGKQSDKLKVYATNTFFYPKLMQGGHQSLRRWTKKVDIFSHDIMLIPVHLDVHWCITIIDFRDQTIRYLDSMGGHNKRAVEALLNYLVEERMDKKKEKFDTNGWKMPVAKNIPQQMNGSDCGMFSCTFAEFYSRDAKFNFSQENMPYLRRKMVYEIISGKLMM